MCQHEKVTEKKMQNLSLQIDLNYKLQLLTSDMFAFGLSSSVLSKVSIADFEHVFVCWEICGITIAVVLILKYLTQQTTNTYSKSATETLKR